MATSSYLHEAPGAAKYDTTILSATSGGTTPGRPRPIERDGNARLVVLLVIGVLLWAMKNRTPDPAPGRAPRPAGR